MEILALLSALMGQISPLFAALAPYADALKVFAPIFEPAIKLASHGPVAWALVWVIVPFYALWFFYLAVMALKRSRDEGTLTGVAYVCAVPFILLAYALDVFVNLTGAAVIFFDVPREGTVTARLKRYAEQPGTWRFALTVFIATHFLDKFDPAGYHVKKVYEIAAGTLEDGATTTLAALAAIEKLAERFRPKVS